MATVTSPVPIDVYLRSTFEPDAEYVDGEIQERAVGELNHAAWQAAIQKWFWLREEGWGIRVYAGLRVQVSPTRFRVPDVVVLENTGPLSEMDQIVHTPPLAVFEILSPEDTLARVMEKLSDYENMGVPAILVIEPRTGKKYQYQSGDLRQADTFELSTLQERHRLKLSDFEEFLK
jgi:Uma2 family endonuclease